MGIHKHNSGCTFNYTGRDAAPVSDAAPESDVAPRSGPATELNVSPVSHAAVVSDVVSVREELKVKYRRAVWKTRMYYLN